MSKELRIGNLCASIPVVQGGMGVGISLSNLAGAVAKEGGVGVISAAQIGFREDSYNSKPLESNLIALSKEIKKAKGIAPFGIVGVNIMVATANYESYVQVAAKAGCDLIVSGAGLPLNLPELVKGTQTCIAPIVSSRKAIDIIARQWKRRYNRYPDMVVIEGPLAGGHLGFQEEELRTLTKKDFEGRIVEIVDYVNDLSCQCNTKIPVVVGGGVFDRTDMDQILSLGADGVQLGTRFVATNECDANINYKLAYVAASDEDVVIVKSPVGMPGRAIRNNFLKRVSQGERLMGPCRKCVKTCNPQTTPYCISKALINAAVGDVDNGLIFCGQNVGRVKNIVSVHEIMSEFAD